MTKDHGAGYFQYSNQFSLTLQLLYLFLAPSYFLP